MSDGRFGDPVEDAAVALRRGESRDYNLAGIQTYLVLEDAEGRALVRGVVAAEEADGTELAHLAARYLGQIAADPANPTEAELGCALEVLGTHHFESPGERP